MLQEELDEEFTRLGAQEIGPCDTRRRLYDELFDELVRQEIIVCPERGRLLRMVRREAEVSLESLLKIYESSIAYGIKKKLTFSTEKTHLTSKVTDLLSKVREVNDEIRDLEQRIGEIKEKCKEQEEEKQAELQQVEKTQINENADVLQDLKDCINLNIDVEVLKLHS